MVERVSKFTGLKAECFNRKLTSEIPLQMANLTSLSVLDLSYCGLKGSVPRLPQLTELDVSFNPNLHPYLTRMLQHQWPELRTPSIQYTNVISGSVPSLISNAPLLVSLSAHGCSIQGSLPSSISNLSRLQSLVLSGNNITGRIPKSICKIFSLQELYLYDNNITGTVPSCITNLKNLTVFSVSKNSIEGNVSLINLINNLDLNQLELSPNRLTVVIDQRFHLYSKFKLELLALRSCNIKGVFPNFICEMRNLGFLDFLFNFSTNKLHGRMPLPPQAFSGISAAFDLSDNKLSGEISVEGGKRLSSFYFLNLDGNEFSGPIPFSMFSKDSGGNPKFIDLSNNKFSGSIPYSLCTPNPTNIDLSNNKLSGTIPTSIGYCTELVSLNLGTNNLSGNVPSELEQQKSLSYLQLNDNNLDGAPLNLISKLQDLRVLNLANNHFEGSIPVAFGSLLSLSILSLRIPRGNHFDTLSGGGGSAFVGNDLLCGVPTKKLCDGDQVTRTSNTYNTSENDQEDAKEKILCYGVIALGFLVGFWGLLFFLLLRKEKWWFSYWRFVDCIAVNIIGCIWR
ncbi:hypothetical protein MKW92_050599 [Papaver armeniacum]|nr:hypothetical protein MKW92_050599 [Papaver armeniacum]